MFGKLRKALNLADRTPTESATEALEDNQLKAAAEGRRTDVLAGYVIKIDGPYGIIKPSSKLPPPYTDGNVHFSTKLASVEEGKKVEFILSDVHIIKPLAKLVWLCEDSLADQAQDECETDDGEKIPGIVVELNGDEGMILPSKQLPQGFQTMKVHFRTELADVDPGDNVEFTLRKGTEEKPSAKNVWFITEEENLQQATSANRDAFLHSIKPSSTTSKVITVRDDTAASLRSGRRMDLEASCSATYDNGTNQLERVRIGTPFSNMVPENRGPMDAAERTTAEVFAGYVVNNNGLHGYIKPMTNLPHPHTNGNVYFSTNLANVKEGKKVEFILNDTHLDEPSAKLVWLCEDSLSNQAKEEPETDDCEKIPGKVVERNGEDGMIQPLNRLPQGFQTMKVHFGTELADVDPGDYVEFTLRKGTEERPSAKNVWYITKDESITDEDSVNMKDIPGSNGASGALKEISTKGKDAASISTSSKKETSSSVPLVYGATPNQPKEVIRDPSLHKTGGKETDPKQPEKIKRKLDGQRMKGSIEKMMPTYGFIKVTGEGAENFPGNIFFPMTALRSGGLDLIKGDEVNFTVGENKGHNHKWRAFNVKIIRFQPRKQIIDIVMNKVLDEDDNSDVLLEIMNVDAVWEMIGNYQEIDTTQLLKILVLFLTLEQKSKAMPQSFKNVLEIITSSNFCKSQSGQLMHWIEKYWESADSDMEETIKAFFLTVVEYLPHKARMITALCKFMLPEGTVPMVNFLYDMLRKVTLKNASEINDLDWNELPLVPSKQELLTGPLESHGLLSPVKVKGGYASSNEYMDTYFRLLRADCFSALRSGICDFLENKLDPRDMKIYREVRLVGVNITEYGKGISLAIKVKPQNKVKNWETSSNLMFGNLLCFSPSGKFDDTIWATVKQRDSKLLKSDQVIWVELCTESNTSDDVACLCRIHEASGRTILAESPTYYTAYQPVLRALQKMDPEDLAFQEELVHIMEPKPSQYFQNIDPAPDSLDRSQAEAFEQALKQRLSIIQGPPGTGKTYIGIEITRRILRSLDILSFPILVLTYKNHALDEFLKAVLEFIPGGVARVGGRCREPALEALNINNLRKKDRQGTVMYRQRQELLSVARSMKRSLEIALSDLERSSELSCKTILHGFSGPQIENLLSGSLGFCKLFDNSGKAIDLKKVWEANKEIIYDEELTTDDKCLELDHSIIKWIGVALQVWMPQNEVFNSIMTNEERLSCFLSSQSLPINVKQKKVKEDGNKDDTDIEDELKERLSAFWQTEKQLEMTVKFNALGNSHFPKLIPCAKRLAGEITRASLKSINDVWELPPYDRAVIIQVILWNHRAEIEEDIKKHFEKYKGVQNSINELENQHKVSILKSKKVVGMTITGASIHQQLLQALKPAIVIVEEAAEVLEPQLIAVLGNWAKHLLLIGDHKQLRPQVETYDLVKNFNFDLSMMERLIKNDYPYKTLSTQNRMRPEIAVLLQDIYPDLQNNMMRVQCNAPPDFIPSAIYFWTHEDLEGIGGKEAKTGILQEAAQAAIQGRSLANLSEAERVIKLALLFIQQGYKPSEITILAAYQGQVKLLRSLYRQSVSEHWPLFQRYVSSESPEEGVEKVRIHTIDMYQGDENEIVIVSLVRSNPNGNIGFLKSLNRRCVAQSRAKCGLYIIGSYITLMSRNSPWSVPIRKLARSQLVGPELPMICSRHPDFKISARTAGDIPLDGICKKTCHQLMGCNVHHCEKTCQPFHNHDASDCNVEIQFIHSVCGHGGTRKCYTPEKKIRCKKPCPKLMGCKIHPCPEYCQPEHSHLAAYCMIEVAFTFSGCRHMGKKKCGEDESLLLCEAKVSFQMKKCSHIAKRRCYQNENDISCNELCPRELPCGHPCSGLCGDACDPSKCETCEKIKKVEMQKLRELEKKRIENAKKAAERELEALKQKQDEVICVNLLQTGDTASEYFDVEDRVRKYIQPSHHWFPQVTKIVKVFNPKLEAAWLKAKMEMFDPTRSELKFHGTAEENIEKIVNEGFKLSSGQGNMYGGGIYFATDSSKSAQERYTQGSNKLLLCDVLIGKSLTVERAVEDMSAGILQHKRYDSLYAKRGTKSTGGVVNDEYVVYNSAQALPKYIVEYNQLQMNLAPSLPVGAQKEYHVLKPKRHFDVDDPLDVHFRIAESQFMRLTDHLGSKQRVTTVEYFFIPNLCANFIRKQTEFENTFGQGDESKPVLAFHGTKTDQNIDNIMRENFDISKCSRFAYGKGIYFSEFPDVSKSYAGTNKLILCKVLPGKSYTVSSGMRDQPIQSGYNSHIVSADAEGRGQMLIVYDVDQILPTYVITYE